MELILCFGVAISAFIVAIVCIVGLINAPTPILLCILVAGIMLTQKSINNLNEPNALLIDEAEQNKIEKVEMMKQDNQDQVDEQKKLATMVYRGSHYNQES